MCDRVIGTIRRVCLDWLIPISEVHLRAILRECVAHYNGGRCHGSLGPGVPDPPRELVLIPKSESPHRMAAGSLVLEKSILGGLSHEYSLVTARAGTLSGRSKPLIAGHRRETSNVS
jgi:putative transposase